MQRVAFTVALAFAFSAPACAEMKQLGAPTGKWAIFGQADPMTDKMTCVAYYGGDKHFQLTVDSFAVAYGGRGGLKGYTIRFDNDAPLSMALPTRIEEQMGAFVIDTKDPRFARLAVAKRVRIQALTFLGMVNDDIDLTDLQATRGRLAGPECS